MDGRVAFLGRPAAGTHWPPLAPPASEGARFDFLQPCRTFRMHRGGQCGVEWDEWQLVRALVRRNSTVLELGARFGTTSCVLSQAVGPRGVVVAVEPDKTVYPELLSNVRTHRCKNVFVLQGTVGAQRTRILARKGRGGVGTLTIATSSSNGAALPFMRLPALEARIGRSFDTLLLDCEGCITTVLVGTFGDMLLTRLQLILIEQDNRNVSYAAWWPRLRAHGFVRVWHSSAWYSNRIFHSAWLKVAEPGNSLACEVHKWLHRDSLDTQRLKCALEGTPEARRR